MFSRFLGSVLHAHGDVVQRGGSSSSPNQDDYETDSDSEDAADGDELKAVKAEGDEPCKLVSSGMSSGGHMSADRGTQCRSLS